MKIRRGDIFVTDLESVGENVGSEQSSKRPAVIIQNDTGNEYSPTTIVAFILSKIT
ncbi:MAG: type II toxin-antitoxin system PemK/MazF family toxin [Ruminococcus flavefaciens]|nr:type II toxin-antitoxin system PemK/MazF family toxin [Ruminococcus flavefaciens]